MPDKRKELLSYRMGAAKEKLVFQGVVVCMCGKQGLVFQNFVYVFYRIFPAIVSKYLVVAV